MRIDTMLREKRNMVAVVILAVVVLVPIGYYAIRNAFSASPVPFLEMPDPKYKECVRDTYYMRLRHMDLLKEIREKVVREGQRSEITFADCRGCHTSKDRFCQRCHNVVNLYVDCFGCHNYEEPSQAQATARRWGPGTDMNEFLSESGD